MGIEEKIDKYLEEYVSAAVRKTSAVIKPKGAPPSEFKYPIQNRSHAANALARVEQFGTADEKKKVRAAVCKKYPDFPSCQKGKK